MKTTKGEIFTRKTKKNGTVYVLRYQTNGQRFTITLKDELGRPITNKRDATKAADQHLAPITIKDDAARKQAIANSYRDALETAKELEEANKPKTPLTTMWQLHPWNVNTRGNTERDLSATSVKDNLSQWTKFTHWAEANDVLFAEDVQIDHVKAFRESLKALSNARINKITLCCKVMFDLSDIDPNPFKTTTGRLNKDSLRQKAHKPQGRRELTVDELERVCQSATGELRTLLAIGMFTGLRLGDACRLTWRNIAPNLKKITVDPSKTRYKNNSVITIPVHRALKRILGETPMAERAGDVLPELAVLYNKDKVQVSRKIQRHFIENEVQTHLSGTGGDTGTRAVVDVGFHSLRHSFVSNCARSGVALNIVQELCSHGSPEVQKLYLHNSLTDSARAIDCLPDVTSTGGDTDTDKRQELANIIEMLPAEHIPAVITFCNKLTSRKTQ